MTLLYPSKVHVDNAKNSKISYNRLLRKELRQRPTHKINKFSHNFSFDLLKLMYEGPD